MKPVKRADLNLFEHEGNEKIIGEVFRSNIGVVFIVASTAVMITLLTVLAGIVGRDQNAFTDAAGLDADLTGVLSWFLIAMTVIILIGMMVAIYVYGRNYLVLTDQKLVVVRTYNPVSRKISQLSIGDIQDVSVEQKTLGSRMFKYGTIIVETAGEQSNLRMSLIDRPFEANRAIVQAHEANMKQYGN